jgi:hypothetical protein
MQIAIGTMRRIIVSIVPPPNLASQPANNSIAMSLCAVNNMDGTNSWRVARPMSVQQAMQLCCILPEGSEATSGCVFSGGCLSG